MADFKIDPETLQIENWGEKATFIPQIRNTPNNKNIKQIFLDKIHKKVITTF
jgi:hypothetical protein